MKLWDIAKHIKDADASWVAAILFFLGAGMFVFAILTWSPAANDARIQRQNEAIKFIHEMAKQ